MPLVCCVNPRISMRSIFIFRVPMTKELSLSECLGNFLDNKSKLTVSRIYKSASFVVEKCLLLDIIVVCLQQKCKNRYCACANGTV